MFKQLCLSVVLLSVSCAASDVFPSHFASDTALHEYLLSRADVQKALTTREQIGSHTQHQLTENEVRAVSRERAGWIRENLSAKNPIHMLIKMAGSTFLDHVTVGDVLFAFIASRKEQKKKKKSCCCPWW